MDHPPGSPPGREDEIQVYDLHKSFGRTRCSRASRPIHRGEVVCVIGPSGSGKSTFLRCLNLLEQPTSGKVFIDGVEITDLDCDIDAIRRRWAWCSSSSTSSRT
jgi:polar amino acid transport system ATP-binding protein